MGIPAEPNLPSIWGTRRVPRRRPFPDCPSLDESDVAADVACRSQEPFDVDVPADVALTQTGEQSRGSFPSHRVHQAAREGATTAH